MARIIASPLRRACAVAGMASMLMGASVSTSVAATVNFEEQGSKKAAKPEKDQSAKDKSAKDKGRDHDTTTIVVDRDGHSRVVREYATRGNLPPGLAKRRTLPPGLSKQLREKGALPPGLRDYYTPVPADWNARLPSIPAYYTRYFVGRDLIIIDTRNDTLVALIRDLLD
ncbi:MAG: hypothetical protein Q8O42_20590 [Acidobacteriota bacterium]|nr:hypothetical protein [Acidobacteriota bacterium]